MVVLEKNEHMKQTLILLDILHVLQKQVGNSVLIPVVLYSDVQRALGVCVLLCMNLAGSHLHFLLYVLLVITM